MAPPDPTAPTPSNDATHFRLSLVAGAYVVAALAGLSVATDVSGSITLIWPPAGIAIASVLLWGRWMLVGVFLGALAANLLTGAGMAAAGIAVGNTAEAACVAAVYALLHPAGGFRHQLGLRERALDVVRLFVAALVGCVVAALIGTASLIAVGALSTEAWPLAGLYWWLGDVLGIVLLTPFVLFYVGANRKGEALRAAARRDLIAQPIPFALALGFAAAGFVSIVWPEIASQSSASLALPEWLRIALNWVWFAGGSAGVVGIFSGRADLEGAGMALLASGLLVNFLSTVYVRPSLATSSALFVLLLAIGCGVRAQHLASQ